MYKLTNDKDDFYHHVKCSCGRNFQTDELYICYHCNKILCRYCLIINYECCKCSNGCDAINCLIISHAKNKKNLCDNCLQCPLCLNSLVKRKIKEFYLLVCPNCYWDSTSIKFIKKDEKQLDVLIREYRDSFNSNFLKKMYGNILTSLKGDENLKEEKKPNDLFINSYSDASIIAEAEDTESWKYDSLEKSIKSEKSEIQKKAQNAYSYKDNYYNDEEIIKYRFVVDLLSCNLEYNPGSVINTINSIDELGKKLKDDLDIFYVMPLAQRHNFALFQQPLRCFQFPKFFDIIPTRARCSKTCKYCKSLIIQAGDNIGTKNNVINLEIANLFIQHFPVCSFFIPPTGNEVLVIKFYNLDFKETSISFKEAEKDDYIENLVQLNLPDKTYKLESLDINLKENTEEDKFLYKKDERCVILNFFIKDEYKTKMELYKDNEFQKKNSASFLIRFNLIVHYGRGISTENQNHIEYLNEMKFTLYKNNDNK